MFIQSCATYEYQAYSGDTLPPNQTAIIEISGGGTTIVYSINGDTKYRNRRKRKSIVHLPAGKAIFELATVAGNWKIDCGSIEFDLTAEKTYFIITFGKTSPLPPYSYNECGIIVKEIDPDSDHNRFIQYTKVNDK